VGSEVRVLPGPPSKFGELFVFLVGDVAQLVEHLLCKQGVVGSIPSISTRNIPWVWDGLVYLQGKSVSVLGFLSFLQRSMGGQNWMFVPSFIVGNKNVLCQGE
jgi:hypothetical protein